ncbi:hypothetical protein COL922a_008364 [Colletotrichum nupharicola]|nr:hypothetical protein COL922a_008364 [Colletotrichum nupharicola]
MSVATRVLPLLALLFLCSFLDRTNVGNAKIIGLEEDLGINNIQYNQGLAVFYATYIARHVIIVVQSHSDFVNGRLVSTLASEREEKFRWSEVGRGVLNLQVWLSSTAYFAILSGLYSFGLFLPTIINDLHIASNANQSQLWSVIPYAVATPVTVLVAFLSDRLRVRGPIMLAVLPISIIGYAVIGNVTAPQTRFAMTCLIAIGMYSAVPCVLSWNSNNSAGHYKRATTSALQLAIANCGGFVATFIYPSTQGPYYHKGHTIILGLFCYAWVATLLNVLWCSKINRDKAAGKYDQFIGTGDDREPEFKMVL